MEVLALFWPTLKLVLVRSVDVSHHITIATDTVPPVVVWFVFCFQFRVASPYCRSLAGFFCCQKENVLRQKPKQIFVRLHELSTNFSKLNSVYSQFSHRFNRELDKFFGFLFKSGQMNIIDSLVTVGT